MRFSIFGVEYLIINYKLVLYRRQLELADKPRLGRIKICIVLIFVLPILISIIIILSYLC